jgi:hypothetical protein
MDDESLQRAVSEPAVRPGKGRPRPFLWFLSLSLALAVSGVFAYRLSQRSTGSAERAEPVSVALEPTPSTQADRDADPSEAGVKCGTVRPPPIGPAASIAPSLRPLRSTAACAQQLIERLTEAGTGKLSAEKAAEFKRHFQDLASQGAAAIPAIRQFLDRNQDVALDEAGEVGQVGYASVRAGLFDVLRQIGGREATDVLVGTLRSTADPAEIALMARYLEELAPGQYRREAVNAARETLDQLGRGQLQAREAGPLFQVLQSYGDAQVAADLERAFPQWHYYATIALAALPEGQGIPSLVQRLQAAAVTGKSPNDFGLQMLAQAAVQSPDAASALVEQARLNQIPSHAWSKVAEGLAGDQYQLENPPSDAGNPESPLAPRKTHHIESGNQNFFSVPFSKYGTPGQAAERRAIVDQLLNATQNPAAVQALKNARAALSVSGSN